MFRLYRSKVKRNLNSGIYNYLKHMRYTGKSVAEIMAMVDINDLELEGNLSTNTATSTWHKSVLVQG